MERERSVQKILDVQKQSASSILFRLLPKTRAKKVVLFIDVWNLRFDQFQGAFLSTGFLALELALFQQFLDDASSLDGKKQDVMVAQSAKDDSASGPLQHQFETPVDCTHDVAMYLMPASPHDRDVMHKARGVM